MSGFSRRPLFWILFAALGLRVTAAFWLQHDLDVNKKRPFLIMGDAQGYWDLGERIAHGQPYELDDPPRRVLRMPGYPALLAVAIRLADAIGSPERAYLIARLLDVGVGTIACGFVALLGATLFDRQVAIVATAIAAVAPPLVGFSVVLLSETLFAAAMLLSLWLLARLVNAAAGNSGRGKLFFRSLLAGAAIGLAVYVRPSWLLFGPCFGLLFALWFIRKRGPLEAIGAAAILVASIYATLLPWAYRNFEVTGHWVFTTLWVGPSLYDGFNPQANGESNLQFFEHNPRTAGMSEYEINRYYIAQSLEFVRDHPGRALELTIEKIKRFWMPWPNAEQFGDLRLALAVAVYFVPIVILAIIGCLTGWRNFWAWTLTLGPILYFSAVHSVFLGSLRYRLPAEYPLVIASAVGLLQIGRWMGLGTRKAG